MLYMYNTHGGQKMVAIRLPQDLETRLSDLALKTGRTKSFYIRQALEEHLEELEDAFLAEERYKTLGETIPLDELLNDESAVAR